MTSQTYGQTDWTPRRTTPAGRARAANGGLAAWRYAAIAASTQGAADRSCTSSPYRVEVFHFDRIALDAARPGVVGRVVDRHGVVDDLRRFELDALGQP